MAQDLTVPIRYLVFCGKPTEDSSVSRFDYFAEAPAALCAPHLSTGSMPDRDATGVFIMSLVEAHQDEILRSRPWSCITCGKPATELLHSALPFLSPGLHAGEDFEPTVLDNAAPICISGGACDRAAEQLVQNFSRDALAEQRTMLEASKTCDNCGRKTGVQLCGGCRLIAYCSKECQEQSWPSHKMQCKKAQRAAGQAA